MNLYNLSFWMVFLIHMWEYKELYPGEGIKLLPPPPHLLRQWLFCLYRTRIGYIWIKKHAPPYLGIRVLSIFLTCDYFCSCFLYKFVQLECLPILLNMLWVILIFCHAIIPCRNFRHSDLVADHHCLNFMEDFVLMNLLPAPVSASPVPPLHLVLFASC